MATAPLKIPAEGTVTPPPAVVPAPTSAPSKPDEKTDAKPEVKPEAKAEITPEARAVESKGSEDNADLVFFMSPYSETLAKGERLQITLNASSAKGLTSGTFNLLIDPKLKLISVSPGDFLTADGGSLEQKPGKDGAVAVSFKKAGASVDSGALLVLQVQALAPGNAPVLIQSGTFMVGKNPIPGRWVNALVTVN